MTGSNRHRLVGNRYYDTENDEALTVIGVDSPLVLIQYEDGTAYDEMEGPDMVGKAQAEQFGVEEGGIDDARYIPLGKGKSIEHACESHEHEWTPTPAELGWDDSETWRGVIERKKVCDQYLQIASCRKCGLSADSISTFLGHPTPEVCDRCGDEIIPGDDDFEFEPTPEWKHSNLCSDCSDTVKAEFETTA